MNRNLMERFGKRFTDSEPLLIALEGMHNLMLQDNDTKEVEASIGMCMGDLVNRNAVVLHQTSENTSDEQMPLLDFSKDLTPQFKHEVLETWMQELQDVGCSVFAPFYYGWLQATIQPNPVDAYMKIHEIILDDNRVESVSIMKEMLAASQTKGWLKRSLKGVLHTMSDPDMATRRRELHRHVAFLLRIGACNELMSDKELWSSYCCLVFKLLLLLRIYDSTATIMRGYPEGLFTTAGNASLLELLFRIKQASKPRWTALVRMFSFAANVSRYLILTTKHFEAVAPENRKDVRDICMTLITWYFLDSRISAIFTQESDPDEYRYDVLDMRSCENVVKQIFKMLCDEVRSDVIEFNYTQEELEADKDKVTKLCNKARRLLLMLKEVIRKDDHTSETWDHLGKLSLDNMYWKEEELLTKYGINDSTINR